MTSTIENLRLLHVAIGLLLGQLFPPQVAMAICGTLLVIDVYCFNVEHRSTTELQIHQDWAHSPPTTAPQLEDDEPRGCAVETRHTPVAQDQPERADRCLPAVVHPTPADSHASLQRGKIHAAAATICCTSGLQHHQTSKEEGSH